MSLSNSKEKSDPVTPEHNDRKTESNTEILPKNLQEIFEDSLNEKLVTAGRKVDGTKAFMDERAHTLDDRLQSSNGGVLERQEIAGNFYDVNAQLYNEAKENRKALFERARQIQSEAQRTLSVNLKTGYSSEARQRKNQEAYDAYLQAYEAMLEEQRAFMEIGRNSFSTPNESQSNSREAMRARNEAPGLLNISTPIKPKPAVDARGEYIIPKAQLNRDGADANPTFRPPETAAKVGEKDKAKEKTADSKIKFGGLVNNFVRQLGDGDIPRLFEEFINSNPTPEQYDAAAIKLGGVYRDFLKDSRLRGDKILEFTSKVREVAESLRPEGKQNNAETKPTPESPEDRHKKYKNYEVHKNSAERAIKCLQEIRNYFEASNNTTGALGLFENCITELTIKADNVDVIVLRGQPIDLAKEKERFGIDDNQLDDYKKLREAQNSLSQGKSVRQVASVLEKQFGEAYGLQQVDLGKVKTLKELNALRIDVSLTAEPTDDPALVGQIKQIRGIGYNIPDVPQYEMNGQTIVGKFNKDVKARPQVVVYKARDRAATRRTA